MTIQKVTETTEIRADQWVCPQSLVYDRICEKPRRVVKVSGQRVYLAEEDGRSIGSFIARKSCVYVCDTQEEGAAVYAISREQDAAISASVKAIKAQHTARINAIGAN